MHELTAFFNISIDILEASAYQHTQHYSQIKPLALEYQAAVLHGQLYMYFFILTLLAEYH